MNELEIRRYLDVIRPDGALFEIRAIDGKSIYSGYFTDSEKAIKEMRIYRNANLYVVFNEIHEACYSRKQRDIIIQTAINTSDNDIVSRRWILIDIDPVRPSGVNSSNDELKHALDVSSKVGKFLRNIGFSNPIFGMSGNGFHMMYRIDVKNTPEATQYVKDFLGVLSIYFSNDNANVDTSVFNPSRITKIFGTHSRKGTDKDDIRPQRLSHLKHIPQNIVVNDFELVKKVANMLPKHDKPSYKNNYNRDRFDIDTFISDNNIRIAKDVNQNGVRKLVLDECPFDSSHKAPDSALFVMPNGAIGFKCLHNSCSHHGWHDVRTMYDPNAYNNIDNSRITKRIEVPNDKSKPKKEKGNVFLQLHEIQNVDRSKIVTIPTGIDVLDSRIIGLNKGEISLISGSNASGKSTFINQFCLNAIAGGFKASIWSGELTASRMKQWLHLQSAGRQYTTQSQYSDNSYYVKLSVSEKIDMWLKDSLYIYNNDYGNNFIEVLEHLEKHIKDNGIDLIVLDNLMSMNILMLEGGVYEKQNQFILELTSFVKRMNVHLILVAHPRKSVSFLRKTDISGSGDLANAVDNIFIVHRVNNDFVRTSGEYYGSQKASEYFGYDNVIECCKNRDLGVQDEMFGVFFEVSSKRFLNHRSENIVYQWTDYIEAKEINIDEYVEPSNIDFIKIEPTFDVIKNNLDCPF